MHGPLFKKILDNIFALEELYHRLLLVVSPPGSGKTAALREVKNHSGARLINVNLELARLMLELTGRQRALQLPRLLAQIVTTLGTDLILLDNIEVLFDVSLKQDPLRLLQGLSRNKTIIAAWNGSITGEYLVYAAAGHPEYRRYPARDLFIVTSDPT